MPAKKPAAKPAAKKPAAKKPAAKKTPAKKPAVRKVVDPEATPVEFAGEALEVPAVEVTPADAGEGGEETPRPLTDIDPKVQAGGVGGAIGLVVLWALQEYADVVPPEIVQGAILLIITGLFAYMKKNAAS